MGEQTAKRPLYFTIKEDIKRKVIANIYRPGDVLPTENSLCEEYGASRVTIRRSIKELIDEGVLERGYGKTARVVCESVPRSLNRLGGLQEQLSADGIKCSSFILSHEKVSAQGKAAEAMHLEPEDLVYRIERLRYANGKPLCYQVLFLPLKLCPDLDVQKLVNTSLYEIIEKDYGYRILDAVQEIQACMADYRTAALLELAELTCMLQVNRSTFLDNGECIEYSESLYVANRYKLSMTLRR